MLGNAFTFYKYKGEVIDLSEIMLNEQMKGLARGEGIERARKMIVHALKIDGSLVFYLDFMRKDLVEYF